MSKRDIMGRVLTAIACIAIVSLLMMSAYTMGRETGRTETVQMVDDLASQYTFMIKDEDGWQLGASKGGDFFPDYTALVPASAPVEKAICRLNPPV